MKHDALKSSNNRTVAKALAMLFVAAALLLLASRSTYAATETMRTDQTLAPGITQSDIYVTVDGGQNVRGHILRIQKGADVSYRASYSGYYSEGSTAESRGVMAENWNSDDWDYQSVRSQAEGYESSADAEGKVIAASNADFFDVTSGKPEGGLILEGTVIKKTSSRPFLAVLNSGNLVIRKAGGKTSDVTDAVGGDKILLWNGNIKVKKDETLKPREAIGICSDGTVVLFNVDGREPASAGVNMYDLAQLMKSQGCTKALNFDGGGSATMLARDQNEEELRCVNTPSDGYERNVASALLVIDNGNNEKSTEAPEITGESSVKISSSGTVFKMSSAGQYRYTVCGVKQTGFFSVNGETYLFRNGKGLTKDIRIGNVTYSFYKGFLESCSDPDAGTVHIGYCGAAADGGQNLLYAYHDGNSRLIIGLNPLYGSKNGKMKNWTSSKDVEKIPWCSLRSRIKKVYIGNGVTTIGNRFLYVTSGTATGGTNPPDGVLKSIRLPSSLKRIGSYSFFNKPNLKNVVIPANVTHIGKYAFASGGKGYIKFRSRKVPSIGSKALSNTGFTKLYVRNTSAWRKTVKAKDLRKYGYRKSVKYFN